MTDEEKKKAAGHRFELVDDPPDKFVDQHTPQPTTLSKSQLENKV
jgi:hypothetical protein